MKKISILLCSIGIAFALTGCGDAMPELTEEENELITEYAVGLLLKYDKYYSGRLVDLTAYEEEQDSVEEEQPQEENSDELEENKEEQPVDNAEVVDVSEEQPTVSSIEEFYAIEGFSFQYTGYDMQKEYPEMTENEVDAFFAMQATSGTQLLILKFQVANNSGMEQELNMLNYGMKSRVSINDDSPKNVLSTMLLNDLRTYKGVLGANESKELVAIVEVPEGTYVENISMQLRNDSDRVSIQLQ